MLFKSRFTTKCVTTMYGLAQTSFTLSRNITKYTVDSRCLDFAYLDCPLYLEVKSWAQYLTIGNKILRKREEIAPREQFFPFFPQYFQFITNFRNQITYSFVKCGCTIYFFFSQFCKFDMSRYGYLELF